jgi:mono/diheme cytochrome c family protein
VHRHASLVAILILAVIVIAIVYAILTLDISALHRPGRLETRIATTTRDWYIDRAASHLSSKPLPDDASAVSAGEGVFGMACASCHGKNGRNPTNVGKAMYPRALDLGSPEVQRRSNRELFWVIKNGIRLSGMPGFGNILSDDEIWQATYYVRSLGQPAVD